MPFRSSPSVERNHLPNVESLCRKRLRDRCRIPAPPCRQPVPDAAIAGAGPTLFELTGAAFLPQPIRCWALAVSQTDPLLRTIEQGGAVVRLGNVPPATVVKFRARSSQPREDDGLPGAVCTLGTVYVSLRESTAFRAAICWTGWRQ